MAASTSCGRLEGGGRGGHGVGAHQHDAVAGGQRLRYWRARSRATSIRVRLPVRAAIQAEVSSTMTWSRPAWRGRAQAQLRDGQQQQRHAQQLQQQRPGLLDAAAARGHGGLLGRDPEAQRGDHTLRRERSSR